MPDQVVFDRGRQTGLYEDFPLAGGAKVKCLVIQPTDGSTPTRVAADSPEADQLRANNPELKDLDAPAKKDKAADKPAATPAAQAHADELGVDLADVKGTGAGGTVTKGDVAAHAEGTA